MKSPYKKWLELIVKVSDSKFGLPKINAMIGVMMSTTNAFTTNANTVATTNATATVTRLTFNRNFLKSSSSDATAETSRGVGRALTSRCAGAKAIRGLGGPRRGGIGR